MPKQTQATTKEKPGKIIKPAKALREDLEKRKKQFEKSGWNFSQNEDSTWDGVHPKHVGFKNFHSLEKGFGFIENRLAEEAVKPQKNEADVNFVNEINIRDIVPSPFESQAIRRAGFDEAGLESLGNSIVKQGLVQPITLRRKSVSGKYEIVIGERRYLAARRKGLETINAFIRDLTNAEAVALQYVENHERKENNHLADAMTFKYLHEDEGWTIQKLADRFGVDARTVKFRLKLNDLIPEAKAQLSSGSLPLRHAYYLASFPEPAQKEICGAGYAYRNGDADDGARPFEHFVSSVEENIVRNLSSAPFDTENPELHMHGLVCSRCPERSHSQGRLFAEISTEDACLNGACFANKTNVSMRLKRLEIAEQMPNPGNEPVERLVEKVPLVTERKYAEDTPFTQKPKTNQVLLEKPECEFSVLSLAIDGEKKGRQVYVCGNAACEFHNPSNVSEIVLGDEELQQKEYEFEQKVKESLREKVFVEAIKSFTDYKPFWINEDLIQALLYQLWNAAGADIKVFIRKVLADWKGIPKPIATPEEVETFVASLDKTRQSQLLFLLTFKTAGYYTNSSPDELKKIAAGYAATEWKLLDARVRLELAPDEFKRDAQNYLEQVIAGTECEPPRFWFNDEESFDDVELVIED